MVEDMLSPVEHALVRAFRTTDARGKLSILSLAPGTAEDWPAPCARPLLSLVPIESNARSEVLRG